MDAASLRDLRLWDSPEGTRVVFELSDATQHQVFALDNPDRIVIDLPAMDAKGAKVANKVYGKGLVAHVRAAPREDGSLRVVLDMKKRVAPKAVLLDPANDYGHRLVLDLSDGEGGEGTAPATVVAEEQWEPKPIIIAVDAGHGGEDPGARGKKGLLEKDVALAISRKLAALISARPGYTAVLTRDGDYYVGLRERVEKARKAQADLFVSIHANAVKNRDVRGSAVYVVSPRGATNESARLLAHRENSADLVGGIGLEDKDSELAAVLIDLSQSSTMEASFDVGGRMLAALSEVNTLQKPDVMQAGFMVLKAPDIPSVLVETAFITNKHEEKLLGDPKQQERIARSLLEGIEGYFKDYRPQELRPPPKLQKVRLEKSGGREQSVN
ncbi:MAG TPA: N-acetylmuramoyl-L-alanine amidase [Nevskiaceae bacterium]|nr:N-acetylmuramoyl-L-alanine amidase [Nevskiaceae bacterium]